MPNTALSAATRMSAASAEPNTAAHAIALDHRNDGLGECIEPMQCTGERLRVRLLLGILPLFVELRDIGASGERLATGAAHDQNAHGRVRLK